MQCSLNCFACPYDDCICEDEDFQETPLEIAEAEARDREARRTSCEADYEGEQAAEFRRLERKRHYYAENGLEQHRAYIEAHRGEINEANRNYYHKNRHDINARRRERRKRNKAIRKALSDQ